MRKSLRRRPLTRFLIPAGVGLFVALTLAGTYLVRREILGRTMVKAMEIGDAGMMLRMARSWPAPVGVTDADRRTPLHVAALIGDNVLIARLVSDGADLRARDRFGCAPLYYARSLGAARTLLDAGAPLDSHNANGESPLVHAVSVLGRHDAKWYVKEPRPYDLRTRWPNFYQVPWGSPELVELYLSRGAKVNDPDNRGWTALRYAQAALMKGRTGDLPVTGWLISWDNVIRILKSHGALDYY